MLAFETQKNRQLANTGVAIINSGLFTVNVVPTCGSCIRKAVNHSDVRTSDRSVALSKRLIKGTCQRKKNTIANADTRFLHNKQVCMDWADITREESYSVCQSYSRAHVMHNDMISCKRLPFSLTCRRSSVATRYTHASSLTILRRHKYPCSDKLKHANTVDRNRHSRGSMKSINKHFISSLILCMPSNVFQVVAASGYDSRQAQYCCTLSDCISYFICPPIMGKFSVR